MNVSNEPDSWSDEEIPGLWSSWNDRDYSCIYRVPNQLRRVNPEAYTPQMLLIGPLHYSKKFAKTDSRYVDYINMERYKKRYLKETENLYGTQTVQEFRRIIELHEPLIRGSYAESTEWIESKQFVEMILRDSVFIWRFIDRFREPNSYNPRDVLFNQPCILGIVFEDLILLENQLPFATLTALFDPFFTKLERQETFRDNIIKVFGLEEKIRRDLNFLHLTDLFWHVSVVTLGVPEGLPWTPITHLVNADMLNCAGVEFECLDNESETSLAIKFDAGKGILTMPHFTANEGHEKYLRNIMALEQSHYPYSAYVCSYINFLRFLIQTEKDVDLLVKKGIIRNCLESTQGSVAKMLHKLCEGVVFTGSNYYHLAQELEQHCQRRYAILYYNLSIAALRRVYFKDLWTGTATVSAVVLLVLTLIGTVASVLQVTNSNNSTKSP
ncbi:unnamed protein product [Microthlaspi erraticum]|uniref:Uncharacterized protein n=1 Tax=Microthlaspi erraticum TaxID=1685480 RepID=A0A6D2HVS1_9BRAS|nr:unnamed protein product [Microthlaspi erraticum]